MQDRKGECEIKISIDELQSYLADRYSGWATEQSMFMKLVEEIGEVAEVLNKRASRKTSDENDLQEQLRQKGIPTMVYYPKPLHSQEAFSFLEVKEDLEVTTNLTQIVLALPMHPYLTKEDMDKVIDGVKEYCNNRG